MLFLESRIHFLYQLH